MKLLIVFKAFIKAWRYPEKAKQFLSEEAPREKEAKNLPEPSHLRLLAILQQSGRFIDFLKEEISSFTDEEVGAAVRKIHTECGKSLEELVTIRPIMAEEEGSIVQVHRGYDPSLIKVIGNVKGEPPFSGVLVHKGWKAHKRSLPKKAVEGQSREILYPAEIEVRAKS